MRSYIIRSLRRGRIGRKIGAEHLGASDATRHSTVVLVVVVRAWADAATAEVQDVRVVAIVRRG